MTSLCIVRFSILILLQIITSFILIYHGKKRISYFTEVILLLLVIWLDKNLWYVIGYILAKVLLVIIIYIIKYFSFYALVSIAKKNGIIAKMGYKLFGKKRFIHFVSRMWNKVDYGIRIKKGIPGMVDKKHQKTGVYFDDDGFPKFRIIATVKLDKKFYNKTRETHFYQANKMLYEQIVKNKRIAKQFTKAEIKCFKEGNTPSKYTWHHHQDKGVLQLVDRQIHADVNHRGGFSIWGKK